MFFLKKKKKIHLELGKSEDLLKVRSNFIENAPFNNSYIISFFQLSAELAKIDEEINDREIKSFSSNFPSNISNKNYIEKLFIEACACKNDYIIAATKIESLFSNNKNLLFQTFDSLFKIAISDNYLNNKEKFILKYIFEKFQLGNFSQYVKKRFLTILDEEYDNIWPIAKKGMKLNHYYKQLIKLYHPDKFYSHHDIAEEYIYMVEERFKKINVDYNKIKETLS